MIDRDLLSQVAWISDAYTRLPIRAIVLELHGQDDTNFKKGPTQSEAEWGHHGGLVVRPYSGPWSWMNRQARQFVDDVVDALRQRFAIDADVPLIVTGGSMGGQCAFIYTRYTRHKVAGCLAICPPCDLRAIMAELPDVPRTVYHALRWGQPEAGYGQPMAELISEHSPIDQLANLPDVPYMIVHGDSDTRVNKATHSDLMATAMRRRGLSVEYLVVPGMGHDGPWTFEAMQRKNRFVLDLFR